MKKNKYNLGRMLYIILLVILLNGLFTMNSTIILGETTIETNHKEFEGRKFEEKITILKNNFKAMNINFQEGKQLEIVFSLQVKDDLPIDIWFLNEDNYLLLSGNAQFLYYMDGSGQQISYAKKIVTLTEHDNYKLIMTNYYTNQTVEVDIAGEIRTYGLESNEKSSEDENSISSMLFYPLLIAVIILGVLITFLFVKIRKTRHHYYNNSNNNSFNKSKGNKSKKNKYKNKNKSYSKKSKSKKSKQKIPEITITTSSRKSRKKQSTQGESFCGHCGKPVTTPFCTGCGQAAAQEAVVRIN